MLRLITAALLFILTAHAADLKQSDIFVAGQNGYHTFRIPALVVATNGALLAFAEGRKISASDSGKIDLILKRSLDGGASWQPLQIVRAGGDDVAGNPAPVVDSTTGIIFLLTTW